MGRSDLISVHQQIKNVQVIFLETGDGLRFGIRVSLV
jgi:hypothetical protein